MSSSAAAISLTHITQSKAQSRGSTPATEDQELKMEIDEEDLDIDGDMDPDVSEYEESDIEDLLIKSDISVSDLEVSKPEDSDGDITMGNVGPELQICRPPLALSKDAS
ncbi:hypothetical protein BGZ76_011687 [Entomortierella beljakovae]|nr:hypothetical protein BGZ76_011687 [Entomortierella beljakovae]